MRLSCGLFRAVWLRASAERLSALPFVHITHRRIAATWQVIQTKSSEAIKQPEWIALFTPGAVISFISYIIHTSTPLEQRSLWDQGHKRGREISLSSTSKSATRRFDGTSGGTRAKWRFFKRRGVSLCSFALFLCSLQNHPSANSTCFLPPSFLFRWRTEHRPA